MKKIILGFMVLCSVALSGFIYADTTTNSNEIGENILNLKEVIQYNKNSNFGYTKNTISVVPDTTYTLIMSYDYIGDYLEVVLNSEFEYETKTHNVPYTYSFINDVDNQHVYTEFIAIEDFYIFTIPYLMNKDVPNYEIMLYQGTYNDFERFEPYVGYAYEKDMYAEIEIDYNQLLTREDIISHIQALNYKGEEISLETIEDTYSSSEKSPGVYQMILFTMSNGLYKTLHLDIKVMDYDPPEIQGDNQIDVSFGYSPSLDEIKSLYDVIDNVDQLSSDDITIKDQGGYSETSEIGTYEIVLSVADLSGNETNKTITIKVEDQKAPVILGPLNLTIYTSDDPYTNSYIINQFSVSDNYDTDLEILIEEDNYLQSQIEGIYTMTLKAIDHSGNKTELEIKIHVIENRGPTIEISNPIIEISTQELLTTSDIDKYLKNELAQQNSLIKNVSITYNEYENHHKQPGSYYVYYDYELNDEIYESRILINVSEEKSIFDYWYLGVGSILIIGTVYLALNKAKNNKRVKKN